jgi:hyperosmotically inducible protein
MEVRKSLGVSVVSIVLAVGCSGAIAGSLSNISEPAGASRGTNATRKSDSELTAQDQGRTESDREVTRKLRRALVKDSRLSLNAKNIKIITIDGKVTLRGQVKSIEERKLIDMIAHQQGVRIIDDLLEVRVPNY